MDKIAIISDIHGNLEALKSVLEDIRNRGIDKIYCIGDIIFKGVHSSECLKLVRENCQVILQGNCDDYFTKEHDLSKIDSEVEKTRIKWGQEIITDEDAQHHHCHLQIGARHLRLPSVRVAQQRPATRRVGGHCRRQQPRE